MTENTIARKVPDSIYDAMMAMLAPYAENLERTDLVAAIEEAMDPFGPLDMITANETCEILRCTRPFLWKLDKEKRLTPFRRNSRLLYRRRDVIRFLKDRTCHNDA